MKIHPNDLLLHEVLDDPESGHDRLTRHLLTCPACRRRLANLRRGSGREEAPARSGKGGNLLRWRPAPVDYGPAFDRAERVWACMWSTLGEERHAAPGLLAELLASPAPRREMLIRHQRRFHTWGVYELLVGRSHEEAAADAAAGEHLALLAIDLSQRLDAALYGGERIADLRARAWGYVGDARRLRLDPPGARQAFETAFAELKLGTGDHLERALLLDLQAALLRAQGRLDDAQRLLRRAVTIFQSLGDRQRAGGSLINLATVHERAGSFGKAVDTLEEALRLIEREEEPRLHLRAQHDLVTNLANAGRFLEAENLYAKVRRLHAELGRERERSWATAKLNRRRLPYQSL